MPVAEISAPSSLAEFRSARAESDRLFGIIKPEAIYDRPIDARHRVIFYVGHLDGFDSIQICREGLGLRSPDQTLDDLFQAGIDPDSSHLPSDQPHDWPSMREVCGYVQRCRERVDEALADAPADVVSMALEHRLMHLETLAYMFHNFSYDRKVARELYTAPHRSEHIENSWRYIPAGDAVLGKANDGTFGWDNEYDQHTESVSEFRIQRFPVTNAEYLEFVRDDGTLPHFWVQRDGQFFFRGMFEEIPLPLDWPVYVTQQQAAAYASWLGKSLPTEAQFHRAAYGDITGRVNLYPWGADEPNGSQGNFDFQSWNPGPVTAAKAGTSSFGVDQLVGNGWEWTRTPFGPFPGFHPRASYPGYSANFFDGEHFVMKGGSPRTAARLLRSSFRNWFRRDYPYVYTKFRCVES